MYKNTDSDSDFAAFLKRYRETIGTKSSSNLSLRDALCNDQYCKATWVNLGYIVFHELTGINVIGQYSNIML